MRQCIQHVVQVLAGVRRVRACLQPIRDAAVIETGGCLRLQSQARIRIPSGVRCDVGARLRIGLMIAAL